MEPSGTPALTELTRSRLFLRKEEVSPIQLSVLK